MSRVRVATALALLTVLTLAGCSSTDPGLKPGAPRPPGRTTPGDAVVPEAGRDYRLLRTLSGRDARGLTDVGDDGTLVLQHGAAYVLLDPRTGRRTRLPRIDSARLVGLTTRTAYLARTPRGRPALVTAVDRSDGSTRTRRLPPVPQGPREVYDVLGASARRVDFTVGRPFDQTPGRQPVWTARAGAARAVEGPGLRGPAVAGTLLTGLRGERTVLVSDDAAEFAGTVGLPARCTAAGGPLAAPGVVALDVQCRDGRLRTLVLDADGDILAEVALQPDAQAQSLSDRWLMLPGYAYDLRAHRLWRTGRTGRTGREGVVPPLAGGSGTAPVLAWPTQDGRVRVVTPLP